MSSERPEKDESWLNKSNMAKSLDISVQAFTKWGVEPVSRIGTEAFFRAADVLKNRLENQEKQQHQSSKVFDDSDLEEQKLRLTTAQARNMEIKNELAEGSLVPADVTVFAVSSFCSECAGILDSIPLKIKRRFPEISVQQLEVIKLEIVKAQNAIAGGGSTLESAVNDHVKSLA